jgi:hypothetical protein
MLKKKITGNTLYNPTKSSLAKIVSGSDDDKSVNKK